VLRRWTEDDRDAIVSIWTEPAVWEVLHPGQPTDHAATATRFDHHLDHWDEHGFGLYTIRERGDDAVLGWAGPTHPDGVPGLEDEVEIGWTLALGGRGRGLATEAGAATAEVALTALELDEVISLIDPENQASLAVARRLGMTKRESAFNERFGIELDVYSLRR
jgi:RimJ/RimL family protein N-acetyltransferase